MQNIFDKFNRDPDTDSINREIARLQNEAVLHNTAGRLKLLLSLIDLTSLNTGDNEATISSMCRKVNEFPAAYPGYPDVAAICVYPSLVNVVKKNLHQDVKIASVAGGFPSSQTFPGVKSLEARMAVEAGADEIDMVISVGSFLAGDFAQVAGEIVEVKKAIGDIHLKVILETGLLGSPENIWKASILAMQAGADFIKTSTGKLNPAATYQAVYIMADAAGEFYRKTGRKTGIKPAGGIVLTDDAIVYSLIIEKLLGDQWLDASLFRIGASRLTNNLLSSLNKIEKGNEEDVVYF